MAAITAVGYSQGIPAGEVENIAGQRVSTATFCDGKRPVAVSLWATWCKPCIKELDTVSELLEQWREEGLDFRFVAVSVDDSRSSSKARAFASGRGWDGMELFFDPNGDF